MQKSTTQDAIVDFMKALRPVFKKYTRHTREKAWDDLTSKRGEKEVQKILANPDRPLNTFKQLAFKEWMFQESGVITTVGDFLDKTGYKRKFEYTIFKNPSKQELLDAIADDKKIKNLAGYNFQRLDHARGFLSRNGDIFVWPLSARMHDQAQKDVGEKMEVCFYVDSELNMEISDYNSGNPTLQLESNPHYQKMMESKPTTTAAPVNPNQVPQQTPQAPTRWRDMLKRKILPGSRQSLPYESVM